MTTNGKVSSRVVELQKAVERTERPLREIDKRIATAEVQLAKERDNHTTLKADRDRAERSYANDEPNSGPHLIKTAEREEASAAKLRGMAANLAELVAERGSLDREYQEASVALAQAVSDEEFAHLEEELGKAKYHLAQVQEQMLQRQKVVNELANRLHEIATKRRDAEQRANQQVSLANFKKANPNAPGFQRTRSGFGL